MREITEQYEKVVKEKVLKAEEWRQKYMQASGKLEKEWSDELKRLEKENAALRVENELSERERLALEEKLKCCERAYTLQQVEIAGLRKELLQKNTLACDEKNRNYHHSDDHNLHHKNRGVPSATDLLCRGEGLDISPARDSLSKEEKPHPSHHTVHSRKSSSSSSSFSSSSSSAAAAYSRNGLEVPEVHGFLAVRGMNVDNNNNNNHNENDEEEEEESLEVEVEAMKATSLTPFRHENVSIHREAGRGGEGEGVDVNIYPTFETTELHDFPSSEGNAVEGNGGEEEVVVVVGRDPLLAGRGRREEEKEGLPPIVGEKREEGGKSRRGEEEEDDGSSEVGGRGRNSAVGSTQENPIECVVREGEEREEQQLSYSSPPQHQRIVREADPAYRTSGSGRTEMNGKRVGEWNRTHERGEEREGSGGERVQAVKDGEDVLRESHLHRQVEEMQQQLVACLEMKQQLLATVRELEKEKNHALSVAMQAEQDRDYLDAQLHQYEKDVGQLVANKNVSAAHLNDAAEEHDRLSTELQKHIDHEQQLELVIKAKEEELEDLLLAYNSVMKENELLAEGNHAMEREVHHIRGTVGAKDDTIRFLREQVNALNQREQQLLMDIQSFEYEMDQTHRMVAKQGRHIQQLEKENSEARDVIHAKEISIDEIHQHLAEVQKKMVVQENECIYLQRRCEDLEADCSRLEAGLEKQLQVTHELEEMNGRLMAKSVLELSEQHQHRQLEEKVKMLQTHIHELEHALRTVEQELENERKARMAAENIVQEEKIHLQDVEAKNARLEQLLVEQNKVLSSLAT